MDRARWHPVPTERLLYPLFLALDLCDAPLLDRVTTIASFHVDTLLRQREHKNMGLCVNGPLPLYRQRFVSFCFLRRFNDEKHSTKGSIL